MAKLIIKNASNLSPTSEPTLGNIDNSITVTEKAFVTFASSRDSASDKTLDTIAADDIIELEFEDGIRIWTSLENFEKDFPGINRRDSAPDTLTISKQLPIGGASRGIAKWALKSLKILGIDLGDELVSKASGSISELVEKQLNQQPGLYQCIDEDFSLKLQKTTPLESNKPILLFLHGTASSSAGSFNELWGQASSVYLKQLQTYFAEHIYAFEHKTLSESPIENAIELIKALNELSKELKHPLQIHLVSHSRGGLVGELLARVDVGLKNQPISDQEIEQYIQASDNEKDKDIRDKYKQQAKQLKQLNKLLDSKIKTGESKGQRKFTIHRFVRTACPARGTTLASERLDRWLSVTMNLIGQIPLLKVSPVYDAFSTFTLLVIKQRANPKEMPGLEAQMPGSPLIRMLNITSSEINGDLSVISGDIEPDSFWGKLKLLIPDLYYRHDHDLVVDTQSMMGGTRRKENNSRSFFDQGPGVNHFQYFSNDKTANMLVQGLLRAEGDHAGFTPIKQNQKLLSSRADNTINENQAIVFLLPGILGSHLQAGTDRVWLDIVDIAMGGMKDINIDAENISAESLIANAYADLLKFLDKDHNVFPFPYDWRLSIETEATRFASQLDEKLQLAEQHKQPLHIIAHSMGGLVARMAFASDPSLWDRLVASNGRLIMLGTPLKGSHVIARTLLGQEKLVKYLSVLDVFHNQQEIIEILSNFPGAIQMLPYQHGSMDLLNASTWEDLLNLENKDDESNKLSESIKQNLLDAQEFWKKISQFKIDHQNMFYIAGKAAATPMDIEIVSPDPKTNEQEVVFLATARGDGRVTWESGIPSNIRSWFLNTSHGNLADYKPAFSGFSDLLHQGETNNSHLSIEPIIERGESEYSFPLPLADKIDLFPDENMIIDSLMGAENSRETTETEVTAPLNVIISHGDLCFASHPLALGHYHDDLIISAESYVNHIFDDRLRNRMLLGLYPGPINTAQVIYNPNQSNTKPREVLIIGLGMMGNLTRSKLADTFCHAALEYATSHIENHCIDKETVTDTQMKLSSLLIGTGAGGISVKNSLLAMILGVSNANKQLQQVKCGRYQFVELEFLERWEDIAHAAAHAMRTISEDPSLKNRITFQPAFSHSNSAYKVGAKVNKVAGGRNRITFQEAEGWWRRLQIHHNETDDSLRFNVLTDKARAEISLQAIDLSQIDMFIEQSIRSTYDDPELSKTLFEMLIPHNLKEQTQNQKDMVLVLNEKAARYPWELLQNRWAHLKNHGAINQECLPMSVEFGMIRQLESETFRSSSTLHSDTALIIGNPLGNSKHFTSLIGAENEAKSITRLLSTQNYNVKTVIGEDKLTDAQKVIIALHTDSYKIMHFAGHGVYNFSLDEDSKLCDLCGHDIPSSKTVTGMVIGENTFLTPANIKSIRFVPDLVFINCCHLGREEGKYTLDNPHQLAANLATEFIRMGVKAVVATGWAVDDQAAETFANTFYKLMSEGEHFGNAVTQARALTYKSHKGSNTWGAYQCYGNPDFQLTPKKRKGHINQQIESVSEFELAIKIEHIGNDAKIGGANIKAIKDKLDQLVRHIPSEWLNCTVNEALGRTYAELGMLSKAADYYQAALITENGQTSLKTIEQLSNINAKLAVEKWKVNPVTPDAEEHINTAISLITDLLKFGETSERLSLLASAYKRYAWISNGDKRGKALEEMEKYYGLASKKPAAEYYPLFNYLTAQMITAWSNNQSNSALQTQINTLAINKTNIQKQTDFWGIVDYADCQLLKNLNELTLTDNKKTIIKSYLVAKKRAGSPKDFASVTEHIEFLLLMAESQIVTSKDKKTLVTTLKEILHALIIS